MHTQQKHTHCMHTNANRHKQSGVHKPQKCVQTCNVGGCSDTTARLKWRKPGCLDLISVYLFVCLWVTLLCKRSCLCESPSINVKCSFNSASTVEARLVRLLLKDSLPLSRNWCHVQRAAICLFAKLYISLSLCFSVSVCVCLHVCSTACACGNRDMLQHNQSTRSHLVQWNPGTYALNTDIRFERVEETLYTALMWLSVHLSVCTHKRECYRTKAQRKCAEATAVWSLWQQTGHCGECGGGFRQGIGYREQALVWWNDADPHSSGLTKDYFGAFWTLPRKHNNFGVSSFIYLLCFPSNKAQERDVYSCFWHLSQGEKEEGCECVCVPECVTVAWTIIAFGTSEPFPKAPLPLWLNFYICSLLQKVCLFCNTTEPNPVSVTKWVSSSVLVEAGCGCDLWLFSYKEEGKGEWGRWRGRDPGERNFSLTTPLRRAKSGVITWVSVEIFFL